jgi:hypothetical protein
VFDRQRENVVGTEGREQKDMLAQLTRLENEMSSVAYWYAEQPTAIAVPPPVARRRPVLRDNQGTWLFDEANQCPGKPVPVNEEMRAMKQRGSVA